MGDHNSSSMMLVVVGVTGLCCSSVAGLGVAWWNNKDRVTGTLGSQLDGFDRRLGCYKLVSGGCRV